MLEENDRRFFRLIAITTTKSKKQMMNRVKNVATTPNNSCDIVDMDESNGNGNENEKCKEDFSLYCDKLNKMEIFREMTDTEWKSELFQFCPLHFMFEVKHD